MAEARLRDQLDRLQPDPVGLAGQFRVANVTPALKNARNVTRSSHLASVNPASGARNV